VQQVLATPSSPHLQRFLKDPVVAENVRKTFTAIYPLDDSAAGHEAKKLALNDETAKGFVLKPQREGGGNNVYRTAIPKFLMELKGNEGGGSQSKGEDRWRGHILMEIIEPPAQENSIFREGVVKTGGVVTELGVFGTAIWNMRTGEVLRNEEAGYLLRTKGAESEEGGVAAGFGCVDSVLLYDV